MTKKLKRGSIWDTKGIPKPFRYRGLKFWKWGKPKCPECYKVLPTTEAYAIHWRVLGHKKDWF